jgi:hypothetical protein
VGVRLEMTHLLVPPTRLESTEPGTAPFQASDGAPSQKEAPVQRTHSDEPPQAAPESKDNTASPSRVADATSRSADRPVEARSSLDAHEAPLEGPGDFRYLVAAQSAQERDLETRYDQLKNRLESASRRLEFADSAMTRIDARLERVRLQYDLDMVASQIRRLRLERAFQEAFGGAGRPETAQPGADPAQSRASDSSAILNLLA